MSAGLSKPLLSPSLSRLGHDVADEGVFGIIAATAFQSPGRRPIWDDQTGLHVNDVQGDQIAAGNCLQVSDAGSRHRCVLEFLFRAGLKTSRNFGDHHFDERIQPRAEGCAGCF